MDIIAHSNRANKAMLSTMGSMTSVVEECYRTGLVVVHEQADREQLDTYRDFILMCVSSLSSNMIRDYRMGRRDFQADYVLRAVEETCLNHPALASWRVDKG